MNFFLDRHQLLLKELLNAKVDFIIIGGYSVIYHGYRRTTGDVDIWIKPDNANKPKLLKEPIISRSVFGKSPKEPILSRK